VAAVRFINEARGNELKDSQIIDLILEGQTCNALMLACDLGNPAIISLLLLMGAKTRVWDQEGKYNPLHAVILGKFLWSTSKCQKNYFVKLLY
jgi:hypothetical protein